MALKTLASALGISLHPIDSLALIRDARNVTSETLHTVAGLLPDPVDLLRVLLQLAKETANPSYLTFGVQFLGRILELGPPSIHERFCNCHEFLPTLTEIFPHSTTRGQENILYILGILLQVGSSSPPPRIFTRTPIPSSSDMLSTIFATAQKYLLDTSPQEVRNDRVSLLIAERLLTTHAYLCDFSELSPDTLLDLLLEIGTITALSSSLIRKLVEACTVILKVSDLYSKISFPPDREIGIPYVSKTFVNELCGLEVDNESYDNTEALILILNARLGAASPDCVTSSFIDDEASAQLLDCREFIEKLTCQHNNLLKLGSHRDFQMLLFLLDILRLSTGNLTDALSRKGYVETGLLGLCVFLLQCSIRAQPMKSGKFGFTGLTIEGLENYKEQLLKEGIDAGVSISFKDLEVHGIFWSGYRAGLLSIITQLMISCPAGQEVLRVLGGLPSIVIHCSGDFGCAGAREWALYAIKVATDFNPMNRAELSKLINHF